MAAIEILRNEHRVIEQVLECVAAIAERSALQGAWDSEAATLAIEFFRTFADGCHHHKEEEFLFSLLEAKGWSRQAGPTGQMVREHRLGREHLDAMSRAVAGDDAAAFRQASENYVRLLREHIAKEDNVLFPMANCTLTPCDEDWLAEQFTRHEAGTTRGTHERCLELANELARRLGIAEKKACCRCSAPARQTGA
jgi:hemerythrin-like domain-containing protein